MNDYSSKMSSSSSPPPAIQSGSDLYSDGSESDETNEASHTSFRSKPSSSLSDQWNQYDDCDDSEFKFTRLASSITWATIHGIVWSVFSSHFPMVLSGREVADIIYPMAFYRYDPEISLFDNTIWTYGTDYALATISGCFAIWVLLTSARSLNPNNNEHKRLARLVASMLVLYSLSTGAGAIAHHFFLTVEERNSLIFRLLWTACVGTVYLAPTSMGMIGNECLRIWQSRSNCPALLKSMHQLDDAYWIIYGIIGFVSCALGFMSFQRPACDIFIAGITQTPSTFYVMEFLYSVPGISKNVRIAGLVGFIMNAFLLPLYPLLVLTLGWSLAATNTLLHANLCVAWSLQGLTLQRIVKSLVDEEQKQQQAIGMKKHQ